MKHTIILFSLLLAAFVATAQAPNLQWLLGRWEVIAYAEQGTQVDKKQDARAQAITVYRNIQRERSRQWYGLDPEDADEYSRKRLREWAKWEQRDSTREVDRIAQAIEMPYFAVFFPDSTLALYNKDTVNNRILFPESRHYVFSPATMSLDVYEPGYTPPAPQGAWSAKWDIQVVSLTEARMTLFLPHEGEMVELVKTPMKLP
jgi:hypothetical protein